ncbi:23 kDa jasmonate-induced protein-like [Diospyros lotus]|uniref:23 kDa jasmonate-induced protein-like n=1 Tax=Diospyros lotus TaxID=55363 RepID=UPI00224D23F5|nr:23 kDa jasmonate-induced protein-like [Diospyros lotus]
MGCNVFGKPITDKTLRGMEEYENYTVTHWDRARVALEEKNEGDKDTKARQYVEKLRQEWGNRACTLCLIYNATGGNVVLVTTHDIYGRIGHAPYPIMIENGQWGAFLHGRTPQEYPGSSAAVVYRGKNKEELPCDWMLAWSNPWDRIEWKNKVALITYILSSHLSYDL